MKKLLLILLCLPFIGLGQSVPQGINYQAVARDANGDVLINQVLTIQFSVISNITTGNISWQETHLESTNAYGLFTAIIGQGTSTSIGSSATFDMVDWGASNHLLRVEIDYGGGFVDMGTTAFMSVPYSLHSQNLIGCTDSSALNYSALANIDDGSCIIRGCTDSTVSNYNPLANLPGFCCFDGCTDTAAFNYNEKATCDDGTCIAAVNGCTDSTALNYNPLANTNDGSCFIPSIGDFYQGGVVFYLDGNGGGLICDIQNLYNYAGGGPGIEWGCEGTININTGTAIGTGNQNTIAILNGCAQSNIAAELCNNSNAQGYTDWFLPSQDELIEIFLNKSTIDSTAIANGGSDLIDLPGGPPTYGLGYWSSSEKNINQAFYLYHYYYGTTPSWLIKNNVNFVRAIRAF